MAASAVAARGWRNGMYNGITVRACSMAASAVSARGWRQTLATFLDSIIFSVCILFLIVLDIAIGLYFDETFNPIPSNVDCYGREHLVAAITTALVLWVFCQV